METCSVNWNDYRIERKRGWAVIMESSMGEDVYGKLRRHGDAFKLSTGMSIERFGVMSERIEEFRRKSAESGERNRKVGGGPKHQVTARDRALMDAMRTKLRLSNKLVGLIFGVSQPTLLSRNLEEISRLSEKLRKRDAQFKREWPRKTAQKGAGADPQMRPIMNADKFEELHPGLAFLTAHVGAAQRKPGKPRGPRPDFCIELSDSQNAALRRLANLKSIRHSRRARAVLAVAEGMLYGHIEEKYGISPKTVKRWCRKWVRLAEYGVWEELGSRIDSRPEGDRRQIMVESVAYVLEIPLGEVKSDTIRKERK